MTKLFIADDEPEVIEGISNFIDWKKNGIELIGYATNGEDALENIRILRPDIVLIDIKMPKLDGLQVIENAKKEGHIFESIILSGHDDFFYAQKALELRSLIYLLKPCRPKEVLEAVLKAKNLLEKEKEKESMINSFISYYNDTLPVLKERILYEIVCGIRNDEEIENLVNKYELKISSGNYCVVLSKFNIDNFSDVFSSNNIRREAFVLACSKLIREELSSIKSEVFRGRNEIVILINSSYEFDREMMDSILSKIKSTIEEKLDIKLYFGVSRWTDKIGKISACYEQALQTIDLHFFTDDIDILYYDDISFNKGSTIYPFEEEKTIINSLLLFQKDTLKEKIENFLNSLYINNSYNKWVIKSAVLVLLGSIIKVCHEKCIDLNDIINSKVFENIIKTEKKESITTLLCNFINLVVEKLEKNENKSMIIKSALNIIEKNYNKSITLDSIAKEVFVTPAYLSILFKRELKINFIDYLNKVRTQKAQELLKNHSLKTYQVANMVGFSDEKYFSQVFKKYTGLTPSQYKESII